MCLSVSWRSWIKTLRPWDSWWGVGPGEAAGVSYFSEALSWMCPWHTGNVRAQRQLALSCPSLFIHGLWSSQSALRTGPALWSYRWGRWGSACPNSWKVPEQGFGSRAGRLLSLHHFPNPCRVMVLLITEVEFILWKLLNPSLKSLKLYSNPSHWKKEKKATIRQDCPFSKAEAWKDLLLSAPCRYFRLT